MDSGAVAVAVAVVSIAVSSALKKKKKEKNIKASTFIIGTLKRLGLIDCVDQTKMIVYD